MSLLSIGKFEEATGISKPTLRRMHREGSLIPAYVSPKGTRYYSQEQVSRLVNGETVNEDLPVLLYARVSTKNQKDDLSRQIDNLKSYAYAKGYQFDVITDIGSGINYKNKGLKQVLDGILAKKYSKIVILYKDRLVRFGFDLIEYIANKQNIMIEIIDHSELSKEEELTDDLVQIITVFANRLYGSGSKKTKRLLDEVKSDEGD